MKKCSKCNLEKEVSLFNKDISKKDGLRTVCRECSSAQKREKRKNTDNPILEQDKNCCKCKILKPYTEFHRDKSRPNGLMTYCKDCRVEQSAEEYKRNCENKKIKSSLYYKENRKQQMTTQHKRNKIRFKEDKFYALTRRLRNRLWYALQKKSWKKNTRFSQYIGCTQDELVNHIQKQFQPGMTWENRKEWHIDHIIPLSSALTEEHMYQLCHYTNLQPMWALDNIKKGNKAS